MPKVSLDMDNAPALAREKAEVADLIVELEADLTEQFLGLEVSSFTIHQMHSWVQQKLSDMNMAELYEYVTLHVPGYDPEP